MGSHGGLQILVANGVGVGAAALGATVTYRRPTIKGRGGRADTRKASLERAYLSPT